MAIKMYGEQQGYPGQPNSLDHYQGLQRQLDGDIYSTNAEIRTLNNKIVKNDYDHTQLVKLQQKHQALMAKRAELEESIRNQQHMLREMQVLKSNENHIRHELGREYVQLSEERKRRAEEERRRAVEQERLMHQHTRRSIEDDFLRKKAVMEEQKKAALEELAQREEIRRREKEQRERQKEDYNRKVQMRSQIQTQKDSVYKQYYNQFMENQDTLHSIYRNKAAVSDRQREQQRNEFQRKEIEQFQQRVARQQEERVYRMNNQKDMLRSFLQTQIQEKQRRKSREREEELGYQNQVARYQVNVAEAEQNERYRRKEEQRRYDQELKVQTRSRMMSQGSPPQIRQSHNPITNPIDFKIGITNPYVIRQYEQAKEKHLGEAQALKVRNLAMVGSATLHHS